jgi:hypothetical protein
MSIGAKIRSLFKKRVKSHNDIDNIREIQNTNENDRFDYTNDVNVKRVQYFSVDKNKIVNTVVPAHMNVIGNELNGNGNEIENEIDYVENNFLYDNYYSVCSSNRNSSIYTVDTTDTITNYINKYFYYNEDTGEYHFTDFDYTNQSRSESDYDSEN